MKKGLGRAEARSSDLASRFSMTLFGVLPAPTGISMREASKMHGRVTMTETEKESE